MLDDYNKRSMIYDIRGPGIIHIVVALDSTDSVGLKPTEFRPGENAVNRVR